MPVSFGCLAPTATRTARTPPPRGLYVNASVHGAAKLGTVSGTDITYVAAKEHRGTGATGETRLAVLSATSFVVAYRDTAVTGNAYAKVGTVSGTVITYGAQSAAIRELPGSYGIALVPLTSTAVVAVTRDNTGSDGGAAVGTVSGTDVTFGSRTTFQSGTTGRLAASGISATQFVVSYENSSGKGAAKVGTVSGTSVAFGSEALFRDAVGGGTLTSFPGALSSTALVVAYTDDADSNHGTAKVSTYGPDP